MFESSIFHINNLSMLILISGFYVNKSPAKYDYLII
jgi:hypothetical protein